MNGVSTSDEDSSETMGRSSRQERALVKAIEVAGAKRSPQSKTPSSLNVSPAWASMVTLHPYFDLPGLVWLLCSFEKLKF